MRVTRLTVTRGSHALGATETANIFARGLKKAGFTFQPLITYTIRQALTQP
jgi:hypothetical protein